MKTNRNQFEVDYYFNKIKEYEKQLTQEELRQLKANFALFLKMQQGHLNKDSAMIALILIGIIHDWAEQSVILKEEDHENKPQSV